MVQLQCFTDPSDFCQLESQVICVASNENKLFFENLLRRHKGLLYSNTITRAAFIPGKKIHEESVFHRVVTETIGVIGFDNGL
jgi:hypothetical protein